MILIAVFLLLSEASTAKIERSFLTWTEIQSESEIVKFPLQHAILQIRATRVRTEDDAIRSTTGVESGTTMHMRLLTGDSPVNKSPITWTTIRSKTGSDVKNEECGDLVDYRTSPCNGKNIQEWAWVFTPTNIVLTCDGEIHYFRQIGGQDSESCRRLGSEAVDAVEFGNMKGFYYRGFPLHGVIGEETSGSAREARSEIGQSTELRLSEAETDETRSEIGQSAELRLSEDKTSEDIGKSAELRLSEEETDKTRSDIGQSAELRLFEEETEDIGQDDMLRFRGTETNKTGDLQSLPTCNCWSKECDYCSNIDCAIKHDLTNSTLPLSVTSTVDDTVLNSIVLYNTDGVELGKFQWNKRGIYLTGCVACRTPRRIRRLVRLTQGQSTWDFSLKRGLLKLRVRVEAGEKSTKYQESFYTTQLIGECARHYQQVNYFSFNRMGCDNTFSLVEGMVAGSRVNTNCAGSCPVL